MATNRKKVFEVLPMKGDLKGIGVNGKMYKFGKDAQMFTTQDAGLAKDIEQIYGSHSETGSRDVVVCEVDNGAGLTPRRVFSVPVLPWKRGEE
jgi:hypothetical protein